MINIGLLSCLIRKFEGAPTSLFIFIYLIVLRWFDYTIYTRNIGNFSQIITIPSQTFKTFFVANDRAVLAWSESFTGLPPYLIMLWRVWLELHILFQTSKKLPIGGTTRMIWLLLPNWIKCEMNFFSDIIILLKDSAFTSSNQLTRQLNLKSDQTGSLSLMKLSISFLFLNFWISNYVCMQSTLIYFPPQQMLLLLVVDDTNGTILVVPPIWLGIIKGLNSCLI